MKKIFQFVSTNVLSGLENVVLNICILVKGCDFTYVSPSGPIDDYLKKYHINHIVVNKITPSSVRKVIKVYNPDVVHGHDVKASLSLACNSFLCHRNNIKIISELHSDDPRMWKHSLRSLLYLFSSPCYDQIIVISHAIINKYIFKRYIFNKTTIIPNIVNVKRIKKMQLYSNSSNDKKWDCVFLGRLSPEKDPLKFVDIIYLLKQYKVNIKAIIIGNGILYNRVKRVINRLDLSRNIKMLGFQQNPYKFLSKSKICIVPSKYEGFGLVALESLLLGVPVIASPTGGLLNIINSSCGGFATSSTIFCDKIKYLLGNINAYHTSVINAKKRANDINNIKLFILKYSNIYNVR